MRVGTGVTNTPMVSSGSTDSSVTLGLECSTISSGPGAVILARPRYRLPMGKGQGRLRPGSVLPVTEPRSFGAEAESPIVWRLSLASPPERVFELLDTDEGRERFWAERSRAIVDGFELEFPGGVTGRVEVLEREAPKRLKIRYFGADAALDLSLREDGGCLFEVTCHCEDPTAWVEFLPGWVSWLLVLKGAVDFGVDLRNGSPERAWAQRYVDQ